MPAAPPAVFTPPAAPAPGAAPAVFVPAGVPTPGAPGAVFTAPGVPTPAAPPVIFGAVVNSGHWLDTNFAGADNDLRFDEVGPYKSPPTTIEFAMGSSGSNSVTVTGNAILIYLRQNLGAFYLPASGIKTLIEGSSAALALVSVSYKAGNNGSGLICQPFPNTQNISFGPSGLTTDI